MASERLDVLLRMNAGQYKREARQASTATRGIGRQATATGTATGRLDQKMSGLATTAKFAVAGVAAGAVAKFGKDSIQAFAGFDDAMNQSIAIMGDVEDAMRGDMADAAREVGKTTRLSAEEAAESYFFLASAGLDANQAIAAMPQVAAFAQAGMFDMATATDLATDAQSALGLTVDDAQENLENLTRVTDVFVSANTLANTSVQQVSEAMTNRAGAAMRALGIDIEEGTAVLGAFADQGIKGQRAGQQLAIVLRDLQTRAIDNKEAFEEAGIAVFDSSGEINNIGEIIGDLEGRFSGLSDEQRRAELATLGFSDRSIAALTTLLGTSDAIREYEEELRNAAGTTGEIADNQMESFQGQLELAKGAVEDLQIELGEALLPLLADIATQTTTMLEPFSELLGLFNDYQSNARALADSESPFDRFLGELTQLRGSLPFAIDAFGQLWDSFTGGEAISEAAATAIEEVGRASGTSADEIEFFAGVAGGSSEAMYDIRDAAMLARPEVGGLAEEQEELEVETSNATTALQNQYDLLRAQTDPLFALRDAANDAAEAEQAVAEAMEEHGQGSPEHLQALQDQQQAYLDLRGRQIDVIGASQQTREEFIDQQMELGATREEAELLIEQYENLEGFEFTPKTISLSTRVSGPGSPTIGSFFGAAGNRQFGGSMRGGQPYMVGEAGREMVIPNQDSFVVNNGDTERLIAAMSGMGQGPTINLHGVSESVARDAQRGLLLAGITRRAEVGIR